MCIIESVEPPISYVTYRAVVRAVVAMASSSSGYGKLLRDRHTKPSKSDEPGTRQRLDDL